MFAISRIFRNTQVIAVAAFVTAAPVAAMQLPMEPSVRFELETSGESAHERVAIPNTLGRDLMTFRFQVEASEPSHLITESAPRWDVRLQLGAERRGGNVRMTDSQRDVVLPRPLGIRFGGLDSLIVEVTLTDGSPRAMKLLVTLEYEPLDRPLSRIAVLPAHADRRPAAGALATIYEWTPAVDGRLLAVAGVPQTTAGTIELVDVGNGAVLWSRSTRSQAAMFGTPGSVIRLGVPMVAGRTYRLTTNLAADTPDSTGGQVVAMVLPAAEPR